MVKYQKFMILNIYNTIASRISTLCSNSFRKEPMVDSKSTLAYISNKLKYKKKKVNGRRIKYR